MNAANQTQPIRVGDLVRLRSGGPEGRVVRTSPGNKYRIAWRFLYYSNHGAEKLTRVESTNHKPERMNHDEHASLRRQ